MRHTTSRRTTAPQRDGFVFISRASRRQILHMNPADSTKVARLVTSIAAA